MKPIQVMIDEDLLRKLDADQEVRQSGRSAVLRRAVTEYLRRSRAKRITKAYEQAYRASDGLGDEFAGWESEASWPEK